MKSLETHKHNEIEIFLITILKKKSLKYLLALCAQTDDDFEMRNLFKFRVGANKLNQFCFVVHCFCFTSRFHEPNALR